jgi:hypothetical protein
MLVEVVVALAMVGPQPPELVVSVVEVLPKRIVAPVVHYQQLQILVVVAVVPLIM